MSLTIGIDTAGSTLSLGLSRDGKPLFSINAYANNSHAEQIKTSVNALLSLANSTPQDITKCAVAVGPGSFTGLRIGLSFLKGFFFAKDIPILPVETTELITASSSFNGTIATALDARQDYVFLGIYEKDGNSIKRIKETEKVDKESFYNSIKSCDYAIVDTMGNTKSTIISDGSQFSNLFDVRGLSLHRGLTASLYGDRSDNSSSYSIIDLEPHYMQKSYAERSRPVNNR